MYLTKNTVLLCILVIVALALVESRFRCHNRCSGHGYCSDYDNVCHCEDGYQGVACEERLCAQDFAWASKAYALDSAHELAECSNAGRCNRRTGLCECSPGFTGLACEKTKCGGSGPEGCNGHGECLTLRETYELIATRKGINVTAAYIADPPKWESTHVTMCACHVGYSGSSCEYRLCPKGDDVMTPHTGFRTIAIRVRSQRRWSDLSGNLLFQFNGESFLFAPGATALTAAACKAAFEGLRNVEEVTCTVSGATDFDVTYTVQFKKFPVLPYENNVFANDGSPPLSVFSCNTDQIRDVNFFQCTITDVNTDKTYPEYTACSNRGICDYDNGVCFCFEQFQSSPNCEPYKLAIGQLVERVVNDNEVLVIESSNPDFDATILKFQTFDIGTARFNILQVTNMDRIVFRMNGYGDVFMEYGGLLIGGNLNSTSSGMTVNTGGITVTGGMTAESDTLVINGRTNVRGGITVTNGGFSVVGNAQFNGDCAFVGGFSVSRGLQSAGGINVLAGGGTVSTGGLFLNGGLTVASSGLSVNKRGVTVFSGGLIVTGGIRLLKVRSSLTVNAPVEIGSDGMVITGGLTILDAGLDTGGGMSIGAGGLVVQEGNLNSGGVFANGGLTVSLSGVQVTGGVTISDLGLRVTGASPTTVVDGATLYNAGLTVNSGLTVDAGGVVVNGGLTIVDGDVNIVCTTPVQIASAGLVVTGGLTIFNTGMVVTNGATVYDSGLVITDGGLSIEAGGLRVTNGLSVLLGGLRVTAGITVFNVGLHMNDLVTVNQGGMIVTGGVTVYDAGVLVTGGVTVANQGMTITNGVTVLSGDVSVTGGLFLPVVGMHLTGGLSVWNAGLRVSGGLTMLGTVPLILNGGLSVTTAGLIIPTGGLTVHNSGVIVASGLTVETLGLLITGGLTVSNLGVNVVAGGLTINTSGLRITGGITLHDSALANEVVHGLTVYNGALVTAGLTVSTLGLRINNGGVTIGADGVRVTGCASVLDGVVAFRAVVGDGITVSNGITIQSGGVTVTAAGLTLHNGGIRVTGGLTLLDTGGLRVTGGLTFSNAGLRTETGVTVFDSGLVVSTGMSIGAGGIRSTGSGNLIVAGGFASDDALTVGADGVRVAGGGLTLVDTGLSVYSLRVRRDGIKVSGGNVRVDGSLPLYGGATILGAGLAVTGGVTLRGISFTSSTSTFTNEVDGGVLLKGPNPAQVQNIGAAIRGGLTANGAVFISGSETVFSDARLKTNITGFVNPLGMVSELHGVYYKWVDAARDESSGRLLVKTSENTTEPLRYVGFLAQEVQKVLPEVVGGSLSDTLGVRYPEVVALLIEAVKELDARTTQQQPPHLNAVPDHATLPSPPPPLVLSADLAALQQGWSIEELRLLRRFFAFDPVTGRVQSAKPYVGSCACGSAAIDALLPLVQRIEKLVVEEAELLQRLRSM